MLNTCRFWNDTLRDDYRRRFPIPPVGGHAQWSSSGGAFVRRGTFLHRVVDGAPPPDDTDPTGASPAVRWDGRAAHNAYYLAKRRRAKLYEDSGSEDDDNVNPETAFALDEAAPTTAHGNVVDPTTGRLRTDTAPLALPAPRTIDATVDGERLSDRVRGAAFTPGDRERLVMRAYRLPLYPRPAERAILRAWFGGHRWVYNRGVYAMLHVKDLAPTDDALQVHLCTETPADPRANDHRLLRDQHRRACELADKKWQRARDAYDQQQLPDAKRKKVVADPGETSPAHDPFDVDTQMAIWNDRHRKEAEIASHVRRPPPAVLQVPARLRKQGLIRARNTLKSIEKKHQRAVARERRAAMRAKREPVPPPKPRPRLQRGTARYKATEVVSLDNDGTPFKGIEPPPPGTSRRCWSHAVFSDNGREFRIPVRDRRVLLQHLADDGGNRAKRAECQLQWNRRTGRFHLLYVLRECAPLMHTVVNDHPRLVALDPGIRAFQTFYDSTGRTGELLHGLEKGPGRPTPPEVAEAARRRAEAAAALSDEARTHLRDRRRLSRLLRDARRPSQEVLRAVVVARRAMRTARKAVVDARVALRTALRNQKATVAEIARCRADVETAVAATEAPTAAWIAADTAARAALAAVRPSVDRCMADLRACASNRLPRAVRNELYHLKRAQRRARRLEARQQQQATDQEPVDGIAGHLHAIDAVRTRLQWSEDVPGGRPRGLRRRFWDLHQRLTSRMRSAHGAAIRWLLSEYDAIVSPPLNARFILQNETMAPRIKRLASAYSHMAFQRRLEEAATLYQPGGLGTTVAPRIVWSTHEAGTSRTCGGCGRWHAALGDAETYECPEATCRLQLPRDVNGARNNLLQAYTALRGFAPWPPRP